MAATPRVPKYSLHRATNQARVWINGKDVYLGEYGSEASYAKYQEVIDQWKRQLLAANEGFPEMTVGSLALLFIRHCEAWYVKGGKQTSQVHLFRSALRPVTQRFRSLNVREFGPLKLKAVREDYIARGNCRETVNRNVRRVISMFRWGVSEELFGASVVTALETVRGLEVGRSEAVDYDPVRPVPAATVNATLPHMTPLTRAAVEVQILTGCRPSEVLAMRGKYLRESNGVVEYHVPDHKMAHKARRRIVMIGPKAMAIVRRFLTDDADAFVFTPHQNKRKRYTVAGYRRAINRASEKAFGMPAHLRIIWKTLRRMLRDEEITKDQVPAKRRELSRQASEWREANCWNPARLRHNFGTAARKEGGIESARVTLGHSSAATSEIYAEADAEKARAVVARIG